MGKLSKQQELSLEIHTKIRFFLGKRIIIIKICIDIPSLHAKTKLTIIQKNGRMKGLFRQDGKTHPIDIGLNDIRIRRRQ